MMMITMFMLIPTFLIMLMNHPLSAGFIVLTQMILVAMSSSILMYSSWYSYILVLIMIVGMPFLFMYMTSVASNEKFKFSVKTTSTISLLLMMSLLILILDKCHYSPCLINSESLNTMQMYSTSLNKYLNFPTMSISATLIITY